MTKEKILVTSALPYANGQIHLGHLSGAYLPADIYVRYHRLKGSDILYICGSDEHGVPITISADKEKVNPKEIIDRYHERNRKAFEEFGMDFDIYSRTSMPLHHKTAQEFFLSYHKNNILIEKKSHHFYDKKAKMFLPDRYVEGTCPKCGYEEARSDECENCNALYDPSELKNPKSKITGETPVLRETSHWYFPLGNYQSRLEAYISEMNGKFGWKENVLQYCKGWFSEGLKDRAVTRDLDWGVKVPLENSEGKVIYVWFEAVLGYVSATKQYAEEQGNKELWREYWQNPSTKYIAFIGKDNTVFHTIIFPSMLMAWNDLNDDKFILPQNVPANEFLNFEGKKFSKSRGWGIDVIEFLQKYPADPLRYTLAANLPENKDTDFYWKEFQARNNNELADILGNFVNRTFTFAEKHFDGCIPALREKSEIDESMLTQLIDYPVRIGNLIQNFKIKDAVLEMMNLARACNKYFNDSEPWKTVKTDKSKAGTTINICLRAIHTLAEIFYPVIPFTSEKIFKMLNTGKVEWGETGKIRLKEGLKLNGGEILFNKIEDKVIEEEKKGLTAQPSEMDALITYEVFSGVVLKVAQIIEAERIPKSEKLLKLFVDLGGENRQIVAGIAKSYAPEELTGRKIIVVANLQPAKLFGVDSNGMLLAADDDSGGLKIIEVDKSVPPGTRVK